MPMFPSSMLESVGSVNVRIRVRCVVWYCVVLLCLDASSLHRFFFFEKQSRQLFSRSPSHRPFSRSLFHFWFFSLPPFQLLRPLQTLHRFFFFKKQSHQPFSRSPFHSLIFSPPPFQLLQPLRTLSRTFFCEKECSRVCSVF